MRKLVAMLLAVLMVWTVCPVTAGAVDAAGASAQTGNTAAEAELPEESGLVVLDTVPPDMAPPGEAPPGEVLPDASSPDAADTDQSAALLEEEAKAQKELPDKVNKDDQPEFQKTSVPQVPKEEDVAVVEPEDDTVSLMADARSLLARATANISSPGEIKYYVWTPKSSGVYTFASSVSSGDTYGYLYDNSWNVLASDDDSGSGLNFSISYYMTGGTAYYFGVKWFSSTATGEIPVTWSSQDRTVIGALDPALAATQAGAAVTAAINSGGTVAYYSFTPSSSGEYIFESVNTGGDTYGFLYDSNWSMLSYNDDGGENRNFRIVAQMDAGTTYYLGAKWYSASTTGNISIRLRRQITVNPISVDVRTTAYVDAGQIVYYSFTPTRSGKYRFESDADYDTYGYLYSAEWQQLASDDDSGVERNFRISYSMTAGNTYYLAARWYTSSRTGSMPLLLSSEGFDIITLDPQAAASQAGVMATAQITVKGAMAYFSITPSKSGIYIFKSNSDDDTYGYLYNADWQLLASDDDSGDNRNFKISYELSVGTTYYYGAKWYSTSKTGNFSIGLSRMQDVVDLRDTGGMISANESAQNGEFVYYSFRPSVSGSYIFESIEISGDPCCTLYDSNWQPLVYNDDGGSNRNFRITHTLTQGEIYYFGVKWYYSSGAGPISVRLYREGNAIVLDPSAAASQAGTTVRTDVQAGQEVFYSFTPTTTGTYVFESVNGAGDDTFGGIYDASKKLLASDDDSGNGKNFRLSRELTAGTTYYFSAKWYFSDNSGVITVRLSREMTYDSFDADRAATDAGDTKTVNVGSYQQAYFSFTPKVSGTYVFDSTNSTGDPYGYLYDANMRQLAENDDGGNARNFRIDFELTAGTTYYYGVRWYSNGSGTINARLRKLNSYPDLNAADANTPAGALATTNISSGGEIRYFSFTPTVSGTYVLESTNTQGDPMGYLYDASWQQLASDDDSGSGINFRLTNSLTANTTYYYGVRFYASTATGDISVRLRRQFTVSFTSTGAVSYSGSKTVINGDTYGALPTISNSAFEGWYTAASGGSRVYSTDTVNLTGNQTLYAHWRSTVQVTFNANGGSVSPSQKSLTVGGMYGELPTPVRSGYNFSGWYTSAASGSQVTSSTMVTQTGSHTLYAHWVAATVAPSSVSVSLQSSTIRVGETTKASATVLPSNASNKTVTWGSNKTTVARVSSSGVVTGVSAGSAMITARTSNGRTSTIAVTVLPQTQQQQISDYSNFCYRFGNSTSSFSNSSSYRIPVERYRQLGFSAAQANALYIQNGRWGGSCFGMTSSSILFYKDVLRESKYTPSAVYPKDFASPRSGSANDVKLRSMIELLQVSQVMPGNVGYRQPSFDPVAVAAELDRGNPVKLGLRSSAGGHAVVIYNYTKSGSTYRFNIYDCSGFVDRLDYTNASNYSFNYRNRYYIWQPNNYCTYSTLKEKYDLLKSSNHFGAANLLELNGKTYTYLFCPMDALTIEDADGRTARITADGEVSGDLPEVQVMPSDYNVEKPNFMVILPTGAYTVTGASSMSLAGETLGVDITDIPAGASVTISESLQKIDISSLPERSDYSVTYHTYDSLFDEITVSGDAYSNTLTAALFSDHLDVTGANLVKADAGVSGKTAHIESFSNAGKTISVQWIETQNNDVSLWIGDQTEAPSGKDDKDIWMEFGGAPEKGAILAERSQTEAPVPSLPSGTLQQAGVLVFEKGEQDVVYYTVDGTDPTPETGLVYPGFIEVNRTMTIRAAAVRDGYRMSEIVALDYILPEVSTPAASHPSGSYAETLYVDLFSATDGAEIYYTTDGSDPLDPTSSIELYSSSIAISESTVLKAFAMADGCVSEVGTFHYRFGDSTITVTPKLMGSSGEITPDKIAQLNAVELAINNPDNLSLNAVFVVAFYDESGKMIVAKQQETAISGVSSTLRVEVAEDVSRAKKMKVFLLSEDYQPVNDPAEMISLG